MDIDRELEKIARKLLKRPPLRRGPYHITDEELRANTTQAPKEPG